MMGTKPDRIGIYVRISRDDGGENYESVENQRDLLLAHVSNKQLGTVCGVYIDDNVSGSVFEREGFERLKYDISAGRIDMVLMKDLSRLGRNNVKTLQMIDYFEERGVRLLTADGRYDSMTDNDTVGIETWVNERYVRDISRKIRSCLRFKIQRGEYVGKAPFGYQKSPDGKNRLVIDETQAHIVRIIYDLYLSGSGYSSISKYLEERGYQSPKGQGWNRITVRRIICSRVYIGDTVQGISEKISFKSKKTRRLPEENWVVTEGTHEAIVSREVYEEAQKHRNIRNISKQNCNRGCHLINGIIYCGDCGSTMYARKRKDGTAYICGNYCRNGRAACTSHFIYEKEIVPYICLELSKLMKNTCEIPQAYERVINEGYKEYNTAYSRISSQLEAGRRQQELLYKDRLEGRISEQLFDRMNIQIEKRMCILERELEDIKEKNPAYTDMQTLMQAAQKMFQRSCLTREAALTAVSRITVFEKSVLIEIKY